MSLWHRSRLWLADLLYRWACWLAGQPGGSFRQAMSERSELQERLEGAEQRAQEAAQMLYVAVRREQATVARQPRRVVF